MNPFFQIGEKRSSKRAKADEACDPFHSQGVGADLTQPKHRDGSQRERAENHVETLESIEQRIEIIVRPDDARLCNQREFDDR